MKKKIGFLVFVVCLVLAQGCIPSLHPLYTKDKIIYLNELEGVWTDKPGGVQIHKKEKVMGEEKEVTVTMKNDEADMPTVWDFRKNSDGGYFLVHQDEKGIKAAFDVYVVKLGGGYFMDFYPADFPSEESNGPDVLDFKPNSFQVFHLLPVHTFAKLIITEGEVKINLFDPDFIGKLLEQRKIRIKHELLVDGGYVLTAQPDELQKFVEKYADNDELYVDGAVVLNKVE